MKMHCPNCGKEIKNIDAIFCKHCGKPVYEMTSGHGSGHSSAHRNSCSSKNGIQLLLFLVAALVVVIVISIIMMIANRDRKKPMREQTQEDILPNTSVGDYVSFGHYEQDNNVTNGAEVIEWQVLAKEDGKLLLISRYALDAKPYNTKYDDVTWETCTLRSWMNNTFCNMAFSASEQARIIENSSSNSDGGVTSDIVFLLSSEEVLDYFDSEEERKCFPTDYAIARGAYTNDETGTCWWWLRSPGDWQDYAMKVIESGSLLGFSVHDVSTAVRPVLWVSDSMADVGTELSVQGEQDTKSVAEASVGEYICFGRYEQDNIMTNGPEPIEWQVIAKEEGRSLVISRYALDNRAYNYSTWKSCTLRNWLNEDFYNSSFYPSEQARILQVINNNSDADVTLDKVFLLSAEEISTYFISDEERMCSPTAYAYVRGSHTDDRNGMCWWWLRSYRPSSWNDGEYWDVIDTNGELDSEDFSYIYAVRPAMWISH